MAPRRNNNPHGGGGVDVQNFVALADHDGSFSGPPVGRISSGSSISMQSSNQLLGPLLNLTESTNSPGNFTRCCIPNGDCFKNNRELGFGLINLDDLADCVKVVCNNDHCGAGQYMHRECFESWEQTVLSSLKSIGRARSWSDRQRAQNLWTKKGYDLVFKACGCKCGRGHLRKDLDWTAPVVFGRLDEDSSRKKRKRNRNNQKPTLALTTQVGYHPNIQSGGAAVVIPVSEHRGRAGSVSSSNGSMSPPASASSEHSLSPLHVIRKQDHHIGLRLQGNDQKSKIELYSERVRSTSGCNGIFSRRLDFSSFNFLPRTRLNSYQVKMEDEGNHGNDETRLFILSSLAQSQKSRVDCILCEEAMLVFDRYPLVDGTFFLSPKQYSRGCTEVKYEGHVQYLTAVCMSCLDGGRNRAIYCRFCGVKWDGSSLVLGTMYSYDIFAAMPCCQERLKCNNCFELLLHPQQRLNFFSDYNHIVSCPYCSSRDAHFVKPLSYCFTKQQLKSNQLP